ncbi:MAG: dihydroorotate dehydrogenase-like protein [Phycisphaerae bacterium]|nr:dihydroorotate dehydrogenase-like protein [Phycisphaerae bacterium]
MNLETKYLGFTLPNPFIVGAGPIADQVDHARRFEDAGASMIIMRSLFEEQLTAEELAHTRSMDAHANSFAEALTYFPDPADFVLGPHEYLDKLNELKRALTIPVVASLNGVTRGGWLDNARLFEEAGADAIELHIYSLPTDPQTPGAALEQRTLEMVQTVRQAVKIPIAVKLSPFYTSVLNVAQQLVGAGANGLVLFNRFYHPDIDVEALEIVSRMGLSNSSDLPLRLRGLALLSGRVRSSLGVTGGVHTTLDVIKAIMSGADGVQLVSALLRHGPGHLLQLRRELVGWLEQHEYDSLSQMKGSMSFLKCPDPSPFNRASYIKVLQTWNAGTLNS